MKFSITQLRDTLIHFNPVWFISIMGTGITSSILYDFPIENQWLRIPSYIMFGICSILLTISTIILFFKLVMDYDNRVNDLIYDMKKNVFLGCYVMGLTSWVNMLHNITMGIHIYVLWWICVILSLFTAWFIFFSILTARSGVTSLKDVNGTLLLPIVTLTVVASTSGLIEPGLPESLKRSTLIVGFLLWSNSIGLSFMVTTIYIYRLVIHKLPSREMIFTTMIPIGFLGQGSFAIQLISSNYHAFISEQNEVEGLIVEIVGILLGLFLQSLGFCFTFFAICSIITQRGYSFFTYGWWAMTFPLGTMCLATKETYRLVGWESFQVVSAIYGVAVTCVTMICLIGSIYLMITTSNAEKVVDDIDDNLDLTKVNTKSSLETMV